MRNLLLNAKPKKMLVALAVAGIQMSFLNPVLAGERESLEQLRRTTTSLVELLVQEGVLSRSKANALLDEARQGADLARAKDEADAQLATTGSNPDANAVENAIDEKLVRVQYVPEIVKQQMKADIKKDVLENLNYNVGERLALPSWIDRFNFFGELRLRTEHRGFDSGNPSASAYSAANFLDDNRGFQLNNTTEDQNVMRFRVRFGFDTQVNDWLSGGMRIQTGGLNDVLSGNTTLQADTGKYEFNLDRAFLKADITPYLSVSGGRFTNPYMHTDLLFDPDLPFDGIAATINKAYSDRLATFGTLGYFPLDEIETGEFQKADAKWMLGAQAGVQWQAKPDTSVKVGLAYYDYNNVEGRLNPAGAAGLFDASAPRFRTKGNSYFNINRNNTNDPVLYGLASEFKELNLNAEIDLATFNPVHVILNADYVKNIGYDRDEIANRTGLGDATITNEVIPDEQTDAYKVLLTVGMPDIYKYKNWQAYIGYKYIEADALLDSYTDSNFFQRGTNAKGFLLGGAYGLDERTFIRARFFSAEEIKPRGDLKPLSVNIFNVDLTAKF